MPDGTKDAQEETGAGRDQNEELKEEADNFPGDEAEKEAFSESKLSEKESLINEFGEERDTGIESESDSESEPEYYQSSSESSDDDMDYVGKGGTYRVPAKYLKGKTEKEKRNISSFTKLHFQHYGKELKREEERDFSHSRFDFPPDPENWREKDLMELWALGPPDTEKTGWDPADVNEEDVRKVNEMIEMGLDPPIAPFYLPYFRRYPVVPRNHADIRTPKDVVEELDRIEEFLVWDSYIFADGSS